MLLDDEKHIATYYDAPLYNKWEAVDLETSLIHSILVLRFPITRYRK